MSGRGIWWSARGLRVRTWALLALSLLMLTGGLMAGLAGHGQAGLAAIAAVFVWARLLAKPWLLTRLRQSGGLSALLGDLAGQVLVAMALFWLGVGLSWLLDWQPGIGFWVPPGLAAAAGMASRLIWRPLPPEWDGFLDEAIAGINGTGPGPRAPDGSDDVEGAAELQAALDALPATGARHHDLVDAVTGALMAMSPEDLRRILHDRIFETTTERDLRALVVAHTDPYVAQFFLGQHDLEELFELIIEAGDMVALNAFLGRVDAVLDSVPEACNDLPTPFRLGKVADGLPAQQSAGVAALIARVRQLRQEHPEP